MSERIAKIGYKDGRVLIHTADIRPGEKEERKEVKLYREPHADFTRAFADLEPHLRDILELPPTVWKDRIRITGVSFSFSEGTEVEGAVITAQAALETADAPLCFNTPHLPFDQYAEGNQAPLMPEDAIDALERLRTEARAYLDGKAAQADLFSHADARIEPVNEDLDRQRDEAMDEIGRMHGMSAAEIEAAKNDPVKMAALKTTVLVSAVIDSDLGKH